MNNKINIIFTFLFLLVLIGINAKPVYAERRLLKQPGIATFNPSDFFSNQYKEDLNKLRILFEKHDDKKGLALHKSLSETIRPDKSFKMLNDLQKEIIKYNNDPDIFEELKQIIDKMLSDVKGGRFYSGKGGVDFKIDEKNKRYVLTWMDGVIPPFEFEEVTKYVPMPPRMSLIIKAEFVPLTRDGKDIKIFRYWVENRKDSEDRFDELSLFNPFPFSYSTKIKAYEYHISETIKTRMVTTNPPDYFNLRHSEKGGTKIYKPGKAMDFPYEVQEMPGGLPGIIEGYIHSSYEVSRYLSAESDPPAAWDIVGKSFTQHMYRGKTIGPVPIPDPFEKSEFIDKIISYNEESIKEGWNDKPEVIEFTRKGLEEIKKNINNKEMINSFISRIEGYYKEEKILSEAYALLKYNLEYLMSKM